MPKRATSRASASRRSPPRSKWARFTRGRCCGCSTSAPSCLLPGKDGLLHISQIAKERVNQVSDYLKEGQVVRVKVLEADEKGRVRLSMKAAAEDDAKQNQPAESTPAA